MSACKCNSSLQNTGFECSPLISDSKRLLLNPLFGSSGALNFIDLANVGLNTQIFWDDMINAASADDRLFPISEHKNGTSVRSATIVETFDDDSKQRVNQGIRTQTIIIAGRAATPTYLKKLKAYACAKFGFYVVGRDKETTGTSHGEIVNGEALKMYPIRVDENTWDAIYTPAQGKNVAKITVTFDWHIDEQDEDLISLTGEEISPVNPLNFEGLIDVYAEYTNITTTRATVELFTEFGPVTDPTGVEGLLVADFKGNTGTASKVYNLTTALDITLTGAPESPAGFYTLAFAAQTTGNQIQLSPMKNGFDFTNVKANPFTI